jgi:serine/threonine-protein kinase HipA
LLFSASRNQLPPLHEAPPFASLERLLLAADQIDQGDYQPSEELVKMLEYGSSMGGARPKVTVSYQGAEWIAKLCRRDDIFDQPKAEYATLSMAEAVGIAVPQHELIEVAGRSVLLVKRFDRHEAGRSHYLSAHASINAHRVRVGDNDGPMSYLRIADVLKKISQDAVADLRDLYRRMAFNVLVGNTDDHLRNHGSLMTDSGSYRLSPAFDLLPHPGDLGLQALIIGDQGRLSSLDNLLSACERFGVQNDEARQIIREIGRVTDQSEAFFTKVGMNAQDTVLLSSVCRRFGVQIGQW